MKIVGQEDIVTKGGTESIILSIQSNDGKVAKIVVPKPDSDLGWVWDNKYEQPFGLNTVFEGHYE